MGIHSNGLLKRLPLLAALSLAPLGLLSIAQAMNGNAGPTATPFIVAESPQTRSFNAVTTHFGKRNPFLLSTNQSTITKDSHCGVVINYNGQPGMLPFERLSFWYKGSPETRAFVTYKPPAGSFITTYLTIKDGAPGQQSKDGFRQVTFNKEAWGIESGSSIKEIAIVPPSKKEAGAFKVDWISLDDNPVRKILSTVFYETNSGPAGASPQVIVPPQYYTKQTGVIFRNLTGQDVYVWVTLGGGKSVQNTFPYYGANGSKTNKVTWNQVGSSSHAWALLPAQTGSTPSAIYSKKSPGNFSGNVTFTPASLGSAVDPTNNCPSSTYICGHTQVEWALNQGSSGNESANISCNNGVNSQVIMNYAYNGSTIDPSTPGACAGASPSPCWAISKTGGAIYPSSVTNSLTLSSNNTIDGVYAFNAPCGGEPTCGPSGGNCNFLYPGYAPPSCTGQNANNSCAFPYSGSPISSYLGNPDASAVQVARAAGVKGGAVHIVVTGFGAICQ